MPSDNALDTFFFKHFPVILIVSFVLALCLASYQVYNAPDCPNGALIHDDVGRFVCVPADSTIILRRR